MPPSGRHDPGSFAPAPIRLALLGALLPTGFGAGAIAGLVLCNALLPPNSDPLVPMLVGACIGLALPFLILVPPGPRAIHVHSPDLVLEWSRRKPNIVPLRDIDLIVVNRSPRVLWPLTLFARSEGWLRFEIHADGRRLSTQASLPAASGLVSLLSTHANHAILIHADGNATIPQRQLNDRCAATLASAFARRFWRTAPWVAVGIVIWAAAVVLGWLMWMHPPQKPNAGKALALILLVVVATPWLIVRQAAAARRELRSMNAARRLVAERRSDRSRTQ